MLTWLLSLALSKLAVIAVPLLLCGAAAFLVLRGFMQLGLAVALVAAGWFVSGLIFQEGVTSCEVKVRAAFDAGVAAQAKANAEADDFQRGLIAGLLQGQRDIAATIKDNDNEAVSDPDAALCGLSLGGVRRYETLRARADPSGKGR